MKANIRFKIFCVLVISFSLLVPIHLTGQITNPDPNKIRTVVVDAGHGGKDSGALGKYGKEKDVALAIALKLGKYIQEKFPEIKVIYTRDTDVFIPLHERAKIANDAHADLFISIHANSNSNNKATGTETFVMGLHKSTENLEVAKKENSVITFEENYKAKYEGFDPNDVESYIMISLIQDTYLDQSLSAATLVQDQFRVRASRKDRGVKQAGFLVLWQTSMPSILIETGFISNPDEEAYLTSESGQDYLASAIFRAFRDYKQHIEGNDAPQLDANDENLKTTDSVKSGSENIAKSSNTNTNLQTPVTGATVTIAGKTDNSANSSVHNHLFKVQIINSSQKIERESELFLDFNDVEEIITEGRYKYLVGSYSTYTDAVEYSKWVKSRYPDAFIVAVSKGKIVPLTPEMIKSN